MPAMASQTPYRFPAQQAKPEQHKHHAQWNLQRDRLRLYDEDGPEGGALHGVVSISSYRPDDTIEPARWECHCGATGEAVSYPDAWAAFLEHENARH